MTSKFKEERNFFGVRVEKKTQLAEELAQYYLWEEASYTVEKNLLQSTC